MNVLVCIKGVPSGSIPMEDTGILARDRAGSELNPGDYYALEAALQIAEETGGQVTALTMGPSSGEAILRTALALGAKEGILLSDPAFAGADVYATAYTLSQEIRRIPDWDVILCGQQTTDGGTAQLPFSLAERLGIPAFGWVKKIEISEDRLILSQELSEGTQQVEAGCPCLMAVGKEIGIPRSPSLRSQLKARNQEIKVLALGALEDADPDHYGLSGSHTRVTQVLTVKKEQKNPPLSLSGQEGAEKILKLCREVTAHE